MKTLFFILMLALPAISFVSCGQKTNRRKAVPDTGTQVQTLAVQSDQTLESILERSNGFWVNRNRDQSALLEYEAIQFSGGGLLYYTLRCRQGQGIINHFPHYSFTTNKQISIFNFPNVELGSCLEAGLLNEGLWSVEVSADQSAITLQHHRYGSTQFRFEQSL